MPTSKSPTKSRSPLDGAGFSAPKVKSISIKKIRRDGGTQPRDHLDVETLDSYVQILLAGTQFPPVTLFHDGKHYWLADGFHRVKAHEKAKQEKIVAEVKTGTRRDAILYSAGANATHGLRRSNADKRRVVETLLHDPEWRQWSDREIASRCNVSHPLVGQIRQELFGNTTEYGPSHLMSVEKGPRLVQRGGKTYTVKVNNIGGHSPRARIKRQQRERRSNLIQPAIVEPRNVSKGETWQLGNRHQLFCGSQSSRKFQALIPNNIALLLLFPYSPKDWLSNIPVEAKSVLAFHSMHIDEMHLETLRNILSNSISGTTDAGDMVVMINLPDPSSFLLMEDMDCNSLCVEPDPQRCSDALAAWAITGQPIKRI